MAAKPTDSTTEALPASKVGLAEEVRALREEVRALREGILGVPTAKVGPVGRRIVKVVKLRANSFSGGRVEIVRTLRPGVFVSVGRTGRIGRHGLLRPVKRALVTQKQLPAARDPRPVLTAAEVRGQSAIARWLDDDTLIPSKDLADAWGISTQALGQAVTRGELFSLKHGNKRLYLGAFVGLELTAIAAVCRALGACDESQKLIFWTRRHGGISGRTAADALAAGDSERVVELAASWAEERGLLNARAAA